jgi:hypothetical protein
MQYYGKIGSLSQNVKNIDVCWLILQNQTYRIFFKEEIIYEQSYISFCYQQNQNVSKLFCW